MTIERGLSPLLKFVRQELFDRSVHHDGALGLQAPLKLRLDGKCLFHRLEGANRLSALSPVEQDNPIGLRVGVEVGRDTRELWVAGSPSAREETLSSGFPSMDSVRRTFLRVWFLFGAFMTAVLLIEGC